MHECCPQHCASEYENCKKEMRQKERRGNVEKNDYGKKLSTK